MDLSKSKTVWSVRDGFKITWHFKLANGETGVTDTRAEARKLRALSFHEVKLDKAHGTQLSEQEE